MDRHTINDLVKFADKSKFNEAEDIASLINQAVQQPMIKQVNGNYTRTFDAGRSIGIDRNTGSTTSITTVVTKSNGDLVTAFPGRP